jgi:hypothetical protein
MGLDLSLLPFDCDHEDFAFSHTMLDCDRDDELFDALQALPSLRVIPNFTSFRCRDDDGDSHYGPTTVTPYGEPLTYVKTKDLLHHAALAVRNKGYGKNKAIWAYLACLDPQTKVALFWH